MTGERRQPRAGTARSGWRGVDDRSSVRIAAATVAAAGLVLGATLYHLPGHRSPVVLWEQDHGSSSTVPDRLGSAAVGRFVDLNNVELPTLAHLAEILHNSFPAVRADVFLSAVGKHGLPQIVRTLEVMASAGFPVSAAAVFFGGGGGGGGAASAPGTAISMPDLELLLQFLMRQLPVALVQGLTDVLAAFIPASFSTVQVDRMVQVLSVAAPASAAVVPVGVVTAVPPPVVSAPPPPPPAPAPPAPAPPPPPAPPVPSPVETPAPPSIEMSTPVPAPTLPEVTTEAPEPAWEIAEPPRDDDLGDPGPEENSGPEAGALDGGESGGQGGDDPTGGISNGSDAGPDAGSPAESSGSDNGPSGADAGGDGPGGT